MTVRVVVYAEGAGDRAGELPVPPPMHALVDEHLGPVHFLVRRLVSDLHGMDEPAVQFEAPLRTRAREVRGSDLLVRATLRQLLTWLQPGTRPHLAIVLVDADGDVTRHASLEAMIAGLPTRDIAVIAVAVQELESWLVADAAASGVAHVDNVEGLEPRDAKAMLSSDRTVRASIAKRVDLERLRTRSPSFARFSASVAKVRVPGTRAP